MTIFLEALLGLAGITALAFAEEAVYRLLSLIGSVALRIVTLGRMQPRHCGKSEEATIWAVGMIVCLLLILLPGW